MKLYDVQVNSYAGYKADERPLCFTFKGKKHFIKNIIHQSHEKNIHGKSRRRFTVETSEGSTFKLCYDEIKDRWFIEGQA